MSGYSNHASSWLFGQEVAKQRGGRTLSVRNDYKWPAKLLKKQLPLSIQHYCRIIDRKQLITYTILFHFFFPVGHSTTTTCMLRITGNNLWLQCFSIWDLICIDKLIVKDVFGYCQLTKLRRRNNMACGGSKPQLGDNLQPSGWSTSTWQNTDARRMIWVHRSILIFIPLSNASKLVALVCCWWLKMQKLLEKPSPGPDRHRT